MAFGSRNRGARALQTSPTAPSSDHVAAMMGSRYCTASAGAPLVGDVAYLRLWRICLGLAGELDDLVEARHDGRRQGCPRRRRRRRRTQTTGIPPLNEVTHLGPVMTYRPTPEYSHGSSFLDIVVRSHLSQVYFAEGARRESRKKQEGSPCWPESASKFEVSFERPPRR